MEGRKEGRNWTSDVQKNRLRYMLDYRRINSLSYIPQRFPVRLDVCL